MTLPSTSRAVVLNTPSLNNWTLEENRPLAPLGSTDVLIKVAASPINPSDLAFMQGQYAVEKTLPVVPGFEASGQIIAVGDQVNADEWVGKRVACFSASGDGTWAQYMVTSIKSVLPVADHISDEAAAMLLVNPLTAWVLIEMAISHGAEAIVQTAAASAIAAMIRRVAARRGLAVIDVVHRPALVDKLRESGAQNVFDSSTPDFFKQLRDACRALKATVALDPVAGKITDSLLRAMSNGSRVIVYGGLSGEPVTVNVDQFVFRDKHVDGFWLSTWMPRNREAVARAWSDVQAHAHEYQSDVRGRYTLDQFGAALSAYAATMSDGKTLITP